MPFNQRLSDSIGDIGEELSPHFRKLMRDHVGYFVNEGKNRQISIDINECYRYRGDLMGLLMSNGMSTRLAWLVCVINGFDDPLLYDGERNVFIVPAEQELSLIWNRRQVLDSEIR